MDTIITKIGGEFSSSPKKKWIEYCCKFCKTEFLQTRNKYDRWTLEGKDIKFVVCPVCENNIDYKDSKEININKIHSAEFGENWKDIKHEIRKFQTIWKEFFEDYGSLRMGTSSIGSLEFSTEQLFHAFRGRLLNEIYGDNVLRDIIRKQNEDNN